jgi:DNA-binding transcriptional LysR family regulator
MNTSQINCFLAAAECLNFTKAAERLFLSQTGLSRQIATMECELGVELFERVRNTVQLTEAGSICVSYLTKVKSDLQKMTEEALLAQRSKQDSISIGGLEGQLVGKYYENALMYFWMNNPNTKIKMFYFNVPDLCKALVDGNVDIGILPAADAERVPGILYRRSRIEKRCLVVPGSHPKADKENPTLYDFQDETFLVLAENDSDTIARQHRQICQTAGFTPKQRIVPDFGTLVMLLEMGVGISVLNAWHSLRHNPKLKFLELPDIGYATEAVAWRKDNKNPNIPVFLSRVIDESGAPDKA